MRRSKVLAKIRAGKCARVAALGHVIPSFFRHAAYYGFDCVWLDLEHRNMSDREVQMLLAHAHLADIDVVIRVATMEKARLTHYLEDGATGLMIPHCSTPEAAAHAVQAAKFPPLGDRGINPTGLDADFNMDLRVPNPTYTEDANRETFIVCQIETLEGLENVEAIAAVAGVDVLLIGPADMGLRLKHDPKGRTLDDVIAAVAEACRANGKAWGIPTGSAPVDALRGYRERGAQFIARGADFSAVLRELERARDDFDAMEE